MKLWLMVLLQSFISIQFTKVAQTVGNGYIQMINMAFT